MQNMPGVGGYVGTPTQGIWVAPGKTYAGQGVRIIRADAGSPGFNTWLGPLSIAGTEIGIHVDFDPTQDGNADLNYCPKLNAGVFGDAVRVSNGNTTSFAFGQVRIGAMIVGTGTTASFFQLDNAFNYRKSGGRDVQFVNTNVPCTLLRTADVAQGAHSFTISSARFDSHSPRNRVLVMEQPRGLRARIGLQFNDSALSMTTPLVEWKHRGVIEGPGGFLHPDIEIDCQQWRRDQAAGFPRRPIPGWPTPLPYTTSSFTSSTKLWISSANTSGWTVASLSADKDPTQNPREVTTAADASGSGNKLDRPTAGAGPRLWAENFNHRDTLLFDNYRMSNSSPSGLDGIGDLEIMFPIILRANFSGTGVVVARDDISQPSSTRGWGVQITSDRKIQWYQFIGTTNTSLTSSNQLELEKAYLVHVRRKAATGDVQILVDNQLTPTTSQPLTSGTLNAGTTLSMGAVQNGVGAWSSQLRALVPELFVDTSLLTTAQIAERKRYLRAAYGVWEGTQLDTSAAP